MAACCCKPCCTLRHSGKASLRAGQQAEGFHDLNRESDPLIGHCPVGEGSFSIPTHAGTITARGLSAFTTMRAGGYFFLPSRSALRYLANPHNRSAT